MKKTEKRHKEVLEKVDKVLNMAEEFMNVNVTFIDFKTLHNAELFVWMEIALGVETMLIEKSKNRLVFYVKAKAGSFLPTHAHDCIEYWKLVEGYLQRNAKEGIIKPYEKHSFEFVTKSRMIVDFER